jgi:hypothetical protein
LAKSVSALFLPSVDFPMGLATHMESLSEKILDLLPAAKELYHRLILVVNLPGGGKLEALRSVQEKTNSHLLNVGLELSRTLLELTGRQRKLQASRILGRLVSETAAEGSTDSAGRGGGVVLLDHIELLFDASLALDPLRLIEEISRNWTLVVAWPGHVEGGWLLYARPDHPEYRRYPVGDLMIVAPKGD